MKKYNVRFTNVLLEEKIFAIKVVRDISRIELKEAKEFVEEKIFPKIDINYNVSIILTEVQFGRFLILANTPNSFLACKPLWILNSFEELNESEVVDMTRLLESM